MTDPEQPPLFEVPPDWTKTWKGMPGYEHVDIESARDLIVHFRNNDDVIKFGQLVGQRITDLTNSIWYPALEVRSYENHRFISATPLNPQYPIYVISKGRWESRLTVKALERINVPFLVVVEPQEYDQYASVIDHTRILKCPEDFSKLGQGSIPVRNFVWEHSIQRGARRHWILDDNIRDFRRYQDNHKYKVDDGTIFRVAEEFVDRYTNVGISGFNYYMFVVDKSERIPPYYLNTRVYSCILIQNDIPYRWRGRYNEDTDLSIRALKDGWCTVLFNAFLAQKMPTLTMKGGNMEELYKDDGRLKMAESLRDQHPDITKITWKWGRWQHHVDYSGFKKNELKLRDDFIMPEGQNDYGMSLVILEKGKEQPIPESSEPVIESLIDEVPPPIGEGVEIGADESLYEEPTQEELLF